MEKITDKIAALPPSSTYFSLEFFPPKTKAGLANLQARLVRMSRALRPLFVNVTWGAGGSTASKSLELAELCQRQLGLTTVLHLTCTNMRRHIVDEALAEAKALGIRNILALRGDPPREEEYGIFEDANGQSNGTGQSDEDKEEQNERFVWAIDLVRYIRRTHGDYFCIGVAAYPEGHADESNPQHQSPEHDMPYLVDKVRAGADFVMTQLFFDVEKYLAFERSLREHPSGAFANIPILPGLMPIQGYQSIRRTIKLSHASIPPPLLARLESVKGDDETVKRVGVDILCEIIRAMQAVDAPSSPTIQGRRGFHFYTLNLEKSVSHIVERCGLIAPITPDESAVEEADASPILQPNGVQNGVPNGQDGRKDRRRLSSANSNPRNRVVVSNAASRSASSHASHEVGEDEAGVPRDIISSRLTTLAISEGDGALGREATWDDFPNGRWGDARSPAYGEIDGYGPSLHVTARTARNLWSSPAAESDISDLFRRYLTGDLAQIPWSDEEGLSSETQAIREPLLRLNDRGWWTMASQPAVNGVRSTDATFGWGPRNGFVFQKPFVEFFLPSAAWLKLQRRLDALEGEVTYFAGNGQGGFASSDENAVNPVTWGAFAGKEIITPTIIDALSFRAWLDEAYSIWAAWQHVYPPASASAKMISRVRHDVWLVNVICHDYVHSQRLWDVLLAE